VAVSLVGLVVSRLVTRAYAARATTDANRLVELMRALQASVTDIIMEDGTRLGTYANPDVLDAISRKSWTPAAYREPAGESTAKLLEDLQKRLKGIEARFPDKADASKVASVNDTLLAAAVQGLSGRLERVERTQLGKWEVAKVVFAVLGALAGVVTIAGGLVRLFGG